MSEKEGKREKATTIRLSEETKARLDKLKVHPRETYEDVIKSLLKVEENTRGERE